jgi:hypothetical protein
MTHTVRTTMQPDREIEVNDADYLDLKRQGLLAENPEAAPAAAPAPAKKTTAGPAGSKES